MISAKEALDRLREGNQRYVLHDQSRCLCTGLERRSETAAGQKPFAVILGCSDSRVPPELIFDQGLGDLFVIRVAGNVIDPTVIGSIEYAVEQFRTQLVVVMGHSRCGAVCATLNELEHPAENLSPHIRSIVDLIRPAVEPLLKTDLQQNRDALEQEAVRANSSAAAHHLRQGSPVIKQLIKNGTLLVVCAEYSLETGIVVFFHGLPETG
jgi:carbonic anhydrase